jgi:hypothetical protein
MQRNSRRNTSQSSRRRRKGMRLKKVIELGSNADPDPQQNFRRKSFKNINYKSKIVVPVVCTSKGYRYRTISYSLPVLSFSYKKEKKLRNTVHISYLLLLNLDVGSLFRIGIYNLGSIYKELVPITSSNVSSKSCCFKLKIFFQFF